MAKIIYLMGPSGSGKDSIISSIRQQSIKNLQVAHRYITRHWQAGGENHVALTETEYERRKTLGLFALAWSANQCQYAIGCEIDTWLNAEQNVLVNGSRAYFKEASARYGQIVCPVLVDVDAHKLEERLIKRGRETLAEITARIQRHRQHRQSVTGNFNIIENNHRIEDATLQLYNIIKRYSQ